MIAPSTKARFQSPGDAPKRIGPYDLLAPLGVGGMASVFLARSFGSAGFERLAAVKLLHRELSADDDFVEMFLNEAKLAARLHHPNAAAIIDLGSEGAQLYMVMEYVQGDTLHAVQYAASARQKTVPLGVMLRIVLDALAGLDAAHELRDSDGAALNLIHRDATPHNVIVGVDGAARLADFGIARAASRSNVTSVGVVKGKLPFMAPEQIRGRSIDRRADVFSMGVTLWESVSLRRCFPNREALQTPTPEREPYRSLCELVPGTPASLDAICRQAMAFEAADRFSTAAAFAEALEQEFRRDVATQRELGRYISEVAFEKVRRERDAVRLSSQPMPDRALRATNPRQAAPVLDLRPPRPRSPLPAAVRAAQRPLTDAIEDSEDVTNIAPPKRPPVRVATLSVTRTSVTSLPRVENKYTINDVPTKQLTCPPSTADSSSLYETSTQAFTLQRPRPSEESLPIIIDTVPPPPAPAEAASAAPKPVSNEAPTVGPPRDFDNEQGMLVRRPPRSFRAPPSRRPRSVRPLRNLARRLWRLLASWRRATPDDDDRSD